MTEELKFKATLDGKPFLATITQMEGAAKSSAAEMFSAFSSGANTALTAASKLFAGIEGGFSALKNAGSVLGSGVREVFDYTRNLENLSERTGISVGRLRDLTRTFEAAGLEADETGSAINRMQRFLQDAENGEEKNADLLRKLGLNFLQLHQLAPEQQFALIGKAIANLRDPIAQGQASMELFSRGGGRLLAVFKDPNFSAGGPLSERARQLQANAKQFDEASVRLSRAGDIFKSFYTGVAAEIATPLNAALDGLERVDLSRYGKIFGDELVSGATAVVDMMLALKQYGFVEKAKEFASWLAYGGKALLDYVVLGSKVSARDAEIIAKVVGSLNLGAFLPDAKTVGSAEDSLRRSADRAGLPGLYDQLFKDLNNVPGSSKAGQSLSAAASKGAPPEAALLLSAVQPISDYYSGAGTAADLLSAVQAVPGQIVDDENTNATNKSNTAASSLAGQKGRDPSSRVEVSGNHAGLDDMTSTGIAMNARLGVYTGNNGLAGNPNRLSGFGSDTGEDYRQNAAQIRDSILYQNPLLLNNAGALNAAVAQEQDRQKNQAKIAQYRRTYDIQHPAEAQARQAAADKANGATSADVGKATTAINNLSAKIDKLFAQ